MLDIATGALILNVLGTLVPLGVSLGCSIAWWRKVNRPWIFLLLSVLAMFALYAFFVRIFHVLLPIGILLSPAVFAVAPSAMDPYPLLRVEIGQALMAAALSTFLGYRFLRAAMSAQLWFGSNTRGFYTIKGHHILGANLHVHWSVVLAAAVLMLMFQDHPGRVPLAIACYFGVILLHESGHAFFAKRLGYQPLNIYLTGIHGLCEYEHPDSERENVEIAWGGALAQLIFAIPLVLLGTFTPLGGVPYANTFIVFFGHFSLAMAVFNLMPIPGLDGAIAWRIVPMHVREMRHKAQAKKTAKALMRRLK